MNDEVKALLHEAHFDNLPFGPWLLEYPEQGEPIAILRVSVDERIEVNRARESLRAELKRLREDFKRRLEPIGSQTKESDDWNACDDLAEQGNHRVNGTVLRQYIIEFVKIASKHEQAYVNLRDAAEGIDDLCLIDCTYLEVAGDVEIGVVGESRTPNFPDTQLFGLTLDMSYTNFRDNVGFYGCGRASGPQGGNDLIQIIKAINLAGTKIDGALVAKALNIQALIASRLTVAGRTYITHSLIGELDAEEAVFGGSAWLRAITINRASFQKATFELP